MFKQASAMLKVKVDLTGISLVQLRNILLQECNAKRNLLTDFMKQNRSMALIKECRELAKISN